MFWARHKLHWVLLRRRGPNEGVLLGLRSEAAIRATKDGPGPMRQEQAGGGRGLSKMLREVAAVEQIGTGASRIPRQARGGPTGLMPAAGPG